MSVPPNRKFLALPERRRGSPCSHPLPLWEGFPEAGASRGHLGCSDVGLPTPTLSTAAAVQTGPPGTACCRWLYFHPSGQMAGSSGGRCVVQAPGYGIGKLWRAWILHPPLGTDRHGPGGLPCQGSRGRQESVKTQTRTCAHTHAHTALRPSPLTAPERESQAVPPALMAATLARTSSPCCPAAGMPRSPRGQLELPVATLPLGGLPRLSPMARRDGIGIPFTYGGLTPCQGPGQAAW